TRQTTSPLCRWIFSTLIADLRCPTRRTTLTAATGLQPSAQGHNASVVESKPPTTLPTRERHRPISASELLASPPPARGGQLRSESSSATHQAPKRATP